jgi:hypothetical protein
MSLPPIFAAQLQELGRLSGESCTRANISNSATWTLVTGAVIAGPAAIAFT